MEFLALLVYFYFSVKNIEANVVHRGFDFQGLYSNILKYKVEAVFAENRLKVDFTRLAMQVTDYLSF